LPHLELPKSTQDVQAPSISPVCPVRVLPGSMGNPEKPAARPVRSVAGAAKVEKLPGLAYMFWSVLQPKRDAILPGERCRLRLNLRPFPFAAVEVAGRKLEKADSLELAAASLWLLVRLG
jgi:hypothetical protein